MFSYLLIKHGNWVQHKLDYEKRNVINCFINIRNQINRKTEVQEKKQVLTLPSGLHFILSSTLSKAGFPVVSPNAAMRSALRGSSNAPTAEPRATAACCHPLSRTRAPPIMATTHCMTSLKHDLSFKRDFI